MNTVLKTGALVIAIAMLFALPGGNANAATHRYCFQQFQACIASGGDEWQCEVEYYACRGMQIPVKSPTMPGNKPD